MIKKKINIINIWYNNKYFENKIYLGYNLKKIIRFIFL